MARIQNTSENNAIVASTGSRFIGPRGLDGGIGNANALAVVDTLIGTTAGDAPVTITGADGAIHVALAGAPEQVTV
ncbi:MAG: hypothetical protein ACRD4F_01530, partial [Candidatus Angelobacter sp.]